jgi:hypothetical protein
MPGHHFVEEASMNLQLVRQAAHALRDLLIKKEIGPHDSALFGSLVVSLAEECHLSQYDMGADHYARVFEDKEKARATSEGLLAVATPYLAVYSNETNMTGHKVRIHYEHLTIDGIACEQIGNVLVLGGAVSVYTDGNPKPERISPVQLINLSAKEYRNIELLPNK